jgi:hypothetical protein
MALSQTAEEVAGSHFQAQKRKSLLINLVKCSDANTLPANSICKEEDKQKRVRLHLIENEFDERDKSALMNQKCKLSFGGKELRNLFYRPQCNG